MGTTVKFVESGSGVLSLLEIETQRSASALRRVAEALFDLRVQIVRAESKSVADRRIERLWVVEFDGAPVRPHHRFDVQVSVLRAIESTARTSYLTQSRKLDEQETLPPAA